MPPSAGATRSLPCSLDAGCARFYAVASTLARTTLWREVARVLPSAAAAGPAVLARSTRAVLASTLARATLWREAACVPPKAEATQGRCHARSTRAALASTLARATLGRSGAHATYTSADARRHCARSTLAALALSWWGRHEAALVLST